MQFPGKDGRPFPKDDPSIAEFRGADGDPSCACGCRLRLRNMGESCVWCGADKLPDGPLVQGDRRAFAVKP